MPKAILEQNGEMKEFEVHDNEPLFDALERQGHELPHGCLAGSCGACRIEILQGDNNLIEPSATEDDTLCDLKRFYGKTVKGVIRLSCRLKIQGPIRFRTLK